MEGGGFGPSVTGHARRFSKNVFENDVSNGLSYAKANCSFVSSAWLAC